jgi:chromosome segregation ATPase
MFSTLILANSPHFHQLARTFNFGSFVKQGDHTVATCYEHDALGNKIKEYEDKVAALEDQNTTLRSERNTANANLAWHVEAYSKASYEIANLTQENARLNALINQMSNDSLQSNGKRPRTD